MTTRIKNSLGLVIMVITGLVAFFNTINLSEAFFSRFVLISIFSFVLGNISWSTQLWIKLPAAILGIFIMPMLANGFLPDNISNRDADNVYVYLPFLMGYCSYWLSVFVCNTLRTQTEATPETPEER